MYILYKYTLTASLFIIQKILFHIVVLLLKQKGMNNPLFFNFKRNVLLLFLRTTTCSWCTARNNNRQKQNRNVSAFFLLFWACTEGVKLYNEYSFLSDTSYNLSRLRCELFFLLGGVCCCNEMKRKKSSRSSVLRQVCVTLGLAAFCLCTMSTHKKSSFFVCLSNTSLHASVYIPYGRRNESPGRYVYRSHAN